MYPQNNNRQKHTYNSTILDFSSAIWHGAEIQLLSEHLSNNLEDFLRNYPESDASSLRTMIARRNGLDEEEIIITNGPTSAFYLIAQAFSKSKVLLPSPGLPEIEKSCTLYNCEIEKVNSHAPIDEWPLEGKDICFITTPNLPDGRIVSHNELQRLFKQYPKVLFVVNQSYASFTTTNKLKSADLKTYANVLMVWSFSQPYGIPGLRIGYITADKKIAQKIWRYFVPSTVTTAALEAAKYILIHPAQFTLPIRKWLRSAQELMSHLKQIDGLEIIFSETPFFLMRVKNGSSASLQQFLEEEKGIKVELGNRYMDISDEYIFIVARKEEENALLINAIEEYFSQNNPNS